MSIHLWFQEKDILNFWSMLFHNAKNSLKVFAVLSKIFLAYWESIFFLFIFTVSLRCNGVTNENNTYFEKSVVEAESLQGKECGVNVCKVDKRICQFRLDFSHFTILGMFSNFVCIFFIYFFYKIKLESYAGDSLTSAVSFVASRGSCQVNKI